MTVQSQTSKVIYNGNGTTTAFSTSFSFIINNDVKVILVDSVGVEVLQAIGTHYSITGAGTGSAGTVTMIDAPLTGQKLIIYRKPELTQLTDYIENDAFPAESHENALDKLTHIAQSLDEQASRGLKLPISSLASSQLPTPITRALLAWNDTANALVNIPIVDLVSTQNRSNETSVLSVTDFNSIGNGIVNDTDAIKNAVATAYLTGDLLYWPTGTYVTTETIPNLHNVRHFGAGVIKRGSDLFYPNPQRGQVNQIYISTTGSNSNDGLSSSQPKQTLQSYADLLLNYTPLLGEWIGVVEAGTYARIRYSDDGIISEMPVKLKGPDRNVSTGKVRFRLGKPIGGTLEEPGVILGTFAVGETITGSVSGFTATIINDLTANIIVEITNGTPQINDIVTGAISGASGRVWYMSPIPTALIKEEGTQAAFGILASNTNIHIENIKIEDYNGTSSSSGIRGDDDCLIRCVNVHLEDCFYGVSGLSECTLDIKGGWFNDCGFLLSDDASPTGHAIRGVFHTKFEVGTQSAGSLSFGPAITACAGVARVQELCTGHLDFVTCADNNSGLRLLVNSRLNIDGSAFYRNSSSAVYATQGCHVDTTANTVFGRGADTNGRNFSGGFGSTASSFGIDGINVANGANPAIFSTTLTTTSVNSITNVAVEEFTIHHDALTDTQFSGIACKAIKCRVNCNLVGTTGTFKRLALRVGATPTIVSFGSANTGSMVAEFVVYLKGSNSQFCYSKGIMNGATYSANNSLSESTSGDLNITLEAVVDNTADRIDIFAIEWEQVGF